MGELIALRRRIDSLGQILEVIAAMRALAAARARQSEQALAGVRAYADTVREALAVSLGLLGDIGEPARPDRLVRVVFGSEHGFVGDLNERVLAAARGAGGTGGAGHPGDVLDVVLVGARGAALAGERGLAIADTVAMATRVAAVEETARRVAARLEGMLGDAGARVELVHATPGRAAAPEIARRALLPIDVAPGEPGDASPGLPDASPGLPDALADPSRGLPVDRARSRHRLRVPPLHHLPPAELVRRFTGEYVVAAIADATMQAFAAENRARLAVTDVAHRELERKLATLRQDERRVRQAEITTELADVLVGVEASGDPP